MEEKDGIESEEEKKGEYKDYSEEERCSEHSEHQEPE